MNENNVNNFELISFLRSFGYFDQKILSALETVPTEFVSIYSSNRNLSQSFKSDNKSITPYIYASILQKFNTCPKKSILVIGTGRGYFSVIASKLFKKVYTVEIKNTLEVLAKNNFKKYKLTNIISKCDNGFYGWKEKGPFDCIFVNGYINKIDNHLLKQVKVGGKCIYPVILSNGIQILRSVEINTDSINAVVEDMLEVNFCPLLEV